MAPKLGKGCIVIESLSTDSDDEVTKHEDTLDNIAGFSKSAMSTLQSCYPLKLMVPSKAGGNNCKWIYPITFGGGLVGGDGIEMSFLVKKNCAALVTGQESTKIYHCEDNSQSYQTVHGTVEDGGLLCILSDPVVCYKDADFSQKQVLSMTTGSNLVYLDWMIGGRVALDELWQLYSYRNKTDIYIDGKLMFRDNYHLQNDPVVPMADSMKSFQVLGSCIVLGQRLEAVSDNLTTTLGRKKSIGERNDPELVCSVSPLNYTVDTSRVKGVYIRFMASTSSKAYKSVISYIVAELTDMIGGNPYEDKY